jgi:hypothetical protein
MAPHRKAEQHASSVLMFLRLKSLGVSQRRSVSRYRPRPHRLVRQCPRRRAQRDARSEGPRVVLEKSFGMPTITKDGVSVANEIELKHKFTNMDAQMIKQVASRTSDVAATARRPPRC